mmetsp:Transcript_115360/g.274200  ORF Transcript_115360/g.274200 Transcript_115360/m.274200 type:complete len:344 (-) Transcript_115360:117-1148(-)
MKQHVQDVLLLLAISRLRRRRRMRLGSHKNLEIVHLHIVLGGVRCQDHLDHPSAQVLPQVRCLLAGHGVVGRHQGDPVQVLVLLHQLKGQRAVHVFKHTPVVVAQRHRRLGLDVEHVVHAVVAHIVDHRCCQAQKMIQRRLPGHAGRLEEPVHHHGDVGGVSVVVVGHVQVSLVNGQCELHQPILQLVAGSRVDQVIKRQLVEDIPVRHGVHEEHGDDVASNLGLIGDRLHIQVQSADLLQELSQLLAPGHCPHGTQPGAAPNGAQVLGLKPLALCPLLHQPLLDLRAHVLLRHPPRSGTHLVAEQCLHLSDQFFTLLQGGAICPSFHLTELGLQETAATLQL